ncbi:MAG TPA: hypothetical protein VIN10_15560 [Bacteroidales bacterium]
MKWLNAIGIIFQFVAFWFAAPELLGSSTLKRFENGLRKLISLIPMVILLIVVAGFGLGMGLMGILKGIKGTSQGLEKGEFINYLVVLSISMLLYVVFMIFFKRIKNWLDVKIAQPLLVKLINNNQTRSTALIVGAILFTAGFICQFIVAIFN